MQAISKNGYLYVTKRGAYSRIFRATKCPHLLPKLILDKLFLQEVGNFYKFFAYKSSQVFCCYFDMFLPNYYYYYFFRPWCRQNQIGICQTCLSPAMGVWEGQRKVRHPIGLQGLDQLDVRRSEENSINVWKFFSKEGGHFPMMMRQWETSRFLSGTKKQ